MFPVDLYQFNADCKSRLMAAIEILIDNGIEFKVLPKSFGAWKLLVNKVHAADFIKALKNAGIEAEKI